MLVSTNSLVATLRKAFLAMISFSLAASGAAAPTQPTLSAIEGRPAILLGTYDLAEAGYETHEFFFGGSAHSYRPDSELGADGHWNVRTADQAEFKSRLVVVRPSDPAKFNGTVVVEWFNVTGGNDTPAFWYVTHRELLRRGYAYVGVSAQSIGVEGGNAVMMASKGLKGLNPARYGSLSHPGDAYSYDIFSQAAALLKASAANGSLGDLRPRTFLAVGESQSAGFLSTYINAVDPSTRLFDGFLVHSRFGTTAALDGVRAQVDPAVPPTYVRFRQDLRAPVLTFITETDLVGARLSGYHGARQKEGKHLRVWEVAGTSHADNYMFGGAFTDNGRLSGAELARIFRPTTRTPVGQLDKPGNPGMVHHYVAQAALAALDRWVRTGMAPRTTQQLRLSTVGAAGGSLAVATNDLKLALGGLRTPWVDVPTMSLSGSGNSGNFVAMLSGRAEPFDAPTMARLYPGGKAEYLKRFTASLDAAIAAGHLLAEDRNEILQVADINFNAAP